MLDRIRSINDLCEDQRAHKLIPFFFVVLQYVQNSHLHFFIHECTSRASKWQLRELGLIRVVCFQDLNIAHGHMAELHNNFFGLPHMFALVKLLGSRSLPWLVRALLDNLSQKVSNFPCPVPLFPSKMFPDVLLRKQHVRQWPCHGKIYFKVTLSRLLTALEVSGGKGCPSVSEPSLDAYFQVKRYLLKPFLSHVPLLQVTVMEPDIENLRRSMPKAIAIPSHDWGVEGNFYSIFANTYFKKVTCNIELTYDHACTW